MHHTYPHTRTFPNTLTHTGGGHSFIPPAQVANHAGEDKNIGGVRDHMSPRLFL